MGGSIGRQGAVIRALNLALSAARALPLCALRSASRVETAESDDTRACTTRRSAVADRSSKAKSVPLPKGEIRQPWRRVKILLRSSSARKASIARHKQVLIDLAKDHNVDERVRSVCAVAVLDRGGVKPIDFDPVEEKALQPAFNPRDYSTEELETIEAALRIIQNRSEKKRRRQSGRSEASQFARLSPATSVTVTVRFSGIR